MERQGAQVKKLEANHAHLISRNNFKVLIFQVGVRVRLHGMLGNVCPPTDVWSSDLLLPLCGCLTLLKVTWEYVIMRFGCHSNQVTVDCHRLKSAVRVLQKYS